MGKKTAEKEPPPEETPPEETPPSEEVETVEEALTRTSEAVKRGELTGSQIRAALKALERKVDSLESRAPKSAVLESQINEMRDSINALAEQLKKKEPEAEEKKPGRVFDFFTPGAGEEEEEEETEEEVGSGEETVVE